MRHKLTKNLIVGGALIGALFFSKASAYDQMNTHPALTNEIVNFYNLNFSQQLSNQDKIWIIKGSIDEDQGIRPMNHFYDPVHNIGMAGFPTSKQWAMSSATQSNFAMSNKSIAESSGIIKSPDDFSYKRVMDDYAQGDRQRAMIGFGHLLHLLEDAGVPAHTRNDPHPPVGTLGSPYEYEMAKWNPGNFNVASDFKKEGLKPVILSNLGDYFDKMAKYSNANFFSKNTISNNDYDKPSVRNIQGLTVNGRNRMFIVGKDKNGYNFPLALIQAQTDGTTIDILISKDIGSYILDGYWDRLSKEVVLNGAGALNLLLTEAEKAKQEYVNKPPDKNWFAKLLGFIGITIGETSVDNSNNGDIMVTTTPKVTSQKVSPTPLVTKTHVINVTTPTPSMSPLKTPTPTPKPSIIPSPSPLPKPSILKISGRVIINEIAWAGTSASATDEWLELYNAETAPVDISSWELAASDNSPDIIFPEGTIIGANSYFLIERTDDNTVSDILADLAVSFGQGGLNNAGEMLKLFDSAGAIVDIVGSPGEAWYSGDSTSKNSMERIDPMIAGNIASNWKSFSGTPVNKDAAGDLINGTPKAKNSIFAMIVTNSGGGGGGGLSSTLTSTATPSPSVTPTPTPSPTPSPSPTPTPTPSPEPSPLLHVVINEIAWMGTSASLSSDEWMELYNSTNQTVDLSGWTLKSLTGTSPDPKITLTGSIGPFGFFLLERTDNTTISDILADQIYMGNLSDMGEILELRDASDQLQDKVSNTGGWYAGSKDTRSTMERINPSKSGDDSANWSTNDGINKNGRNAEGNPVNGTPKARNSVYVALKPSAVTNLVATINSPLKIAWSAPEDLDTLPASLSYDLRYSLNDFSSGNSVWDAATVVASSSLPAVGEKGASQSASFDAAYDYGQTLYFALKTKIPTCDVGNVSGGNCEESDISNISGVTFPTAIDSNAWSMLGKDSYHASFADNLAGPGVGATVSWEFDAGAGNTVGQPVVSAGGDVYFGVANSAGKLIKLDKKGVKQWEYDANVSIGIPAVLSDETVYFGRIGAGGSLTFTALNPDGSKKWDYNDAGTVQAIAVSPKGKPYFTFTSETDKLDILNSDGSLKVSVNSLGSKGFTPVVLNDGAAIITKRISGNQFFNAYSADGTQLWPNELFYTGANGSVQSNPSYDRATGNTYSALGYDGGVSFGFRMFVIPSDGSVLNATVIDKANIGSSATMVSITPDSLLAGLDYSWSNPASGSRLFSLKKSDLSINWFFQAEGKINQQIAVDKDGNAYFSTQSGDIYSVDSSGNERWHISTGISSNISPILTENGLIWGYGSRLTSLVVK